MSIELYIVRHGLAGEHGDYDDDRKRPLTEEGHQKTKKIAKRLKEFGLKWDLILSSPLVRAHQTAEILLHVGLSDRLEESDHLAPGGDLYAWLDWLNQWQQSGGKYLAIVGHEPDLSEWAETLVWGETRHQLTLKKAGVIGLTLPLEGGAIGKSELFWLTPPRFLL